MAYKSLLTYNAGTFSALQDFYSPSAIIPTTGEIISTLYLVISKLEPWAIEDNPPAPEQTTRYLKYAIKNSFFAKKVTNSDISAVVQRVDWKSGTIYDYYRDDIDMFTQDANGWYNKHFWVKNRYDQVFKCLWNNNGSASLNEPFFEPGTFNANQIYTGADGYKWKFLYSIGSGQKVKFLDENWMPVIIQTDYPNPLTSPKGIGGVEVINVTSPGSGYNESLAFVKVDIVGDGIGASANAVVSGGEIVDITVANTGSNYSYANVSITSTVGANATAIAPVSPVGGHGADPLSELGCKHVMFSVNFSEDEEGNLPVDIDYRQVLLLLNPSAYVGTALATANAQTYRLTTDVIVSSGFGAFVEDEQVFQAPPGGDLSSATFTGTVCSFNTSTNELRLINTQGTLVTSGVIYGVTSSTARAVLQINETNFIRHSGYILYLDNRQPIRRNAYGSEQYRLVLGY